MSITENLTIDYFLMAILSPFLGLSINFLFFKKNLIYGSRIGSLGIWIGFINTLGAWFIGLPFSEKNVSWGLIANEISWLIATLILFVSGIVHHFSICYMAGDRNYRRYFIFLNLITISTLLMVAADNIVLFISFWSVSNLILVLLMIHKFQWSAARNSGILAIKIFALGLLFLSSAIGLLAYESGALSLQFIIKNRESLSIPIRTTACFFVILAALTQSGCWPFHRWLISSLNSPTPVSAFMHAGLVNGGGLLLARFSPLFLHETFLLNTLFVLAVLSLILGGIWKLLQSDVKRMLACSTMTQMGFMMMQCGLGLFPAALAHLFWHGLFKAFLFLKCGSIITEHPHTNQEQIANFPLFFASLLSGALGAIGFVFGSGLCFTLVNTTAVLIFFSWIASAQLAHTLLQKQRSLFFILTANFFCLITGLLYGLTVDLIEISVEPLKICQPQRLNAIHILTMTFIFFIWLGLNLKPFRKYQGSLWWRSFYVKMLNASQPAPNTMTCIKNGYKF